MHADPTSLSPGPLRFSRVSFVLLRLGWVGFLFWFSRVFFYVFNASAFPGLGIQELARAFCGGLRFDVSALFAFLAPFIVANFLPLQVYFSAAYQRFLYALYVVPGALLLLLNFIDTAYYPFSQRRLTADFIKASAFTQDAWAPFFFYLLDYWYLFILFFIHLWLLLYGARRIQPRPFRFTPLKGWMSLGWLALSLGLIVLGVRGGVQSRPLSISSAGVYAPTSRDIALVLNTPFSVLNTLQAAPIQRFSYFKDEPAMLASFNPLHCFQKEEPFRPLNVVVIILESFGAEYIGGLNADLPPPYKGYTPFLDSLIDQSLVLDAYANGSISLESVSSIFAGLPSLMPDAYFVSAYAGNALQALPAILAAKGYTTAFFHGGRNGTMGFDRFAKIAGFQRYYGKDEYANDDDYDGVWGVYDGPFLNFFAEKLNQFKQPFCASVFTLSSHHPYTIPPEYKGHFPKGPLGIHESIGYVDHCLKLFFEKVSQFPWCQDTLFVITADHSSSVYHPQYSLKTGRPRIPILYYHPGSSTGPSTLRGKKADYTQQTDIMPTVLDYLNYDQPFLSFGESVLDPKSRRFAVFYRNGSYILRQGGYWLVFDGQHTREFYNAREDLYLQHNLVDPHLPDHPTGLTQHPPLPKQIEMEQFLKSLLQQYQTRLVENRLLP